MLKRMLRSKKVKFFEEIRLTKVFIDCKLKD